LYSVPLLTDYSGVYGGLSNPGLKTGHLKNTCPAGGRDRYKVATLFNTIANYLIESYQFCFSAVQARVQFVLEAFLFLPQELYPVLVKLQYQTPGFHKA